MEKFTDVYSSFVPFIYEILPLSPFRQYIDQFEGSIDFLGHLNWFFPIGDALKVMAFWLTVVSTYYIWSVLLRWAKFIGD